MKPDLVLVSVEDLREDLSWSPGLSSKLRGFISGLGFPVWQELNFIRLAACLQRC